MGKIKGGSSWDVESCSIHSSIHPAESKEMCRWIALSSVHDKRLRARLEEWEFTRGRIRLLRIYWDEAREGRKEPARSVCRRREENGTKGQGGQGETEIVTKTKEKDKREK